LHARCVVVFYLAANLQLADRQLPDWLQPELTRLISQLPVNRVLALAKSDPSIGRGFRLKPASAPVLRQRLRTLLDNNADCAPAIVEELRHQDLCGQVLRVLSEETIQSQFEWLTGYFGAEQWLLATLLDRRLKVRQLADPWIEDPDKRHSLPAREICQRQLAQNLSPFLNTINALTEATPTADNVAAQTPVVDTSRLQSVEAQLRKQTRQQDKLREQLTRAQTATETEKKAHATLRARLAETRESLHRSQAELDMLERSFSERLDAAVQRATASLARYWLQAPTATQDALAQTEESLADQIDLALERQRERDRHYGNREQIKAEIKSLRAAIQRLDDAVLNALNPNRELLPLRSQAQSRLLQLRALIDLRPPPANDTLARLEMAMQTADSPATIDKLTALTDQLRQFDTLDSTQADRIRTARTSRMELIFEQSNPDNQARLPADIRARRAIADSSHAQVLIDGHNCLLAVDAISRRFVDQQQAAGAPGRHWLAQACSTIFESAIEARVTLYFDGDERHEETISGNVVVVYSGGVGDQRADNEIIKQLQYLAADEVRHQAFLISNDRALRQQASDLGANIIDAEVLADWCNLYL
jgi:hypothetical protein